LPACCQAGGLLGYGPDTPALYRRAGGYYVDRILCAAVPADLAVEQSTIFDLRSDEVDGRGGLFELTDRLAARQAVGSGVLPRW
jgi:hypothetical protein